MSVRVGYILRHEDESGVSGTGRVAEWWETSTGKVFLFWLSGFVSFSVYENMKALEHIHGHGGKTEIVVGWEEPRPEKVEEEEEVGGAEEAPETDLEAKPRKRSGASRKAKVPS